MSKKVLFIVGSIREGSFNHQMALEAEKALAGFTTPRFFQPPNGPRS